MKKLLVSASVASVLSLVGCGSEETLQDVLQTTPAQKPFAQVVFDPAGGNLNFPNDLLMVPSGTFFDFTLNLPLGDAGAVPSNPFFALNALDGWSIQQPFVLNVALPAGGLDIDASSIRNGLKIYEATQALLGSSANCQKLAVSMRAPGVPCELGKELKFGIDFITRYEQDGSGTIQIVPLRPLRSAQGYMLVVTEDMKDSDGRGVRGSNTWDVVRQDIDTKPLSSADQLRLQGIVNSFIDVLEGNTSLTRNKISYAAYFSTQSAGTVMSTVKKLQIAPFAQALAQTGNPAVAGQFLPAIVATSVTDAPNAMEKLGLVSDEAVARAVALGKSKLPPEAAPLIPAIDASDFSAFKTCSGLVGTVTGQMATVWGPVNDFAVGVAKGIFAQAGAFCSANRVAGTINLPYYLNPQNPMQDWWKAACTNGVVLRSLGAEKIGALVAAGKVGPNNALCQALPTPLFDLDLSSLGMNDPRNITRFSPVPAARGRNVDNPATRYNEAGTETLNVQFTVPNETIASVIAAGSNGAVTAPTKPAEGWPVVIYQHGITRSKEDALLVSAALSLAGYATVAIDLPIHGERGFVVPGAGPNSSDLKVNASSNAATDYMNLASLLTSRDNLRQSAADNLGLRLGLNALVDMSGQLDLDTSKVYFVGQSLGSITGINMLANANTPLGLSEDTAVERIFNNMYKITAAVPAVPMGGLAGGLVESPTFGPIVKASLLAAGSAEVATAMTAAVTAAAQEAAANGVAFDRGGAIRAFYAQFEQSLSAEQKAANNATFLRFIFAAQTVLDSGDPNAYAARMGANTPTLMQLVVGGGTNDDGSTALPDQVNPITTSFPLYGGLPLSNIMGLPLVGSSSEGSGVVRFNVGSHGSQLNPSPSAAANREMQRQMAAFFRSEGKQIVISDETVVVN